MRDDHVCKFEGPLYGVVLRASRTVGSGQPSFYTRQFNTRPDLGFSEGEYEGHYDFPTLEEAFRDFLERVQAKAHTVEGDLRERDEKEQRLRETGTWRQS